MRKEDEANGTEHKMSEERKKAMEHTAEGRRKEDKQPVGMKNCIQLKIERNNWKESQIYDGIYLNVGKNVE